MVGNVELSQRYTIHRGKSCEKKSGSEVASGQTGINHIWFSHTTLMICSMLEDSWVEMTQAHRDVLSNQNICPFFPDRSIPNVIILMKTKHALTMTT